MIKPEKNPKKTPKIFQKTLNFREKSAKNPINLPARFARRLGGSAGREASGVFPKIFSQGGILAIPSLGHVWGGRSKFCSHQPSPMLNP